MRGALGFDPRDRDYGPATAAIRQILADWGSIDWFEPTAASELEATRLLREHHALGRASSPELFPEHVDVRCEAGGWPEFMAWCERVRHPEAKWDWKYGVLKRLSVAHAKAHAWNLDEQVTHQAEGGPRPGDLFVRYGEPGQGFVLWCGVMPKLDELGALPRETIGDAAGFYLLYAHGDVLDCIKWQLAERSNDLAGNPFTPLLGCYRAGFYPFSLGPGSIVLFRFITPRSPTLVPKRRYSACYEAHKRGLNSAAPNQSGDRTIASRSGSAASQTGEVNGPTAASLLTKDECCLRWARFSPPTRPRRRSCDFRHRGGGESVPPGLDFEGMVQWKKSSAVVVVGAVAVVAGCSRSAPDKQAPEPARETSVATSDDERAALASMEAAIREKDPSIAVVTEMTVERDGQALTQYRIASPSTGLPPGIGSPTLVMYTPIEERVGSSAAADAIMRALARATVLIPGLMSHGQIAVEPVVVYFAVKPGRKVRAWVGGLVQPLLIQDRDRLIHDLGAVVVPEIKRQIVIGIVFPAEGQSVNAFDLPMPPDWRAAKAQAAPRPLVFPEELFAIVWPD